MANNTQYISPKLSVSALVEDFPQTIPVFLKHGMSCVGCSMSAFETLEDAARIYGVDFSLFIAEITGILKENHGKKSEQNDLE